MGWLSRLEQAARRYRDWRSRRVRGPYGDFIRAGGNEMLFANLPVDSDGVVLDVGGYLGGWTAEMSWRYGCRAIVVEPMPAFAEALRSRFSGNRRVEIVAAGLGAKDDVVPMTELADGSSAWREGGRRVAVPLTSVSRFFEEHGLTDVACMNINIEGGEYDVLEAMLTAELCRRVRCLLIQFHRVAPDSEPRRDAIRRRLAETHAERFDYEFIWERWDRKS
jgi:FkbM family methyltransferase